MSKALEPRVQSVLVTLFSDGERDDAEHRLQHDCRPGSVPALDPVACERVQLAALKASNGRMRNLETAIALAQRDWRDLLMVAGFGHDTKAHISWANGLIAKD